MSHSASTPIPAAPTTVKKIKGSVVHGIGVAMAILIPCLVFVTIAWNKHKEKMRKNLLGNNIPKTEQTSTTAPTETFPAADAEYNLANVSYDQILEFTVEPGKSAMVRLTNDWCPDWASDQIDVFDQRNEKRVLYHYRYVQGSATAENITYWMYKNEKQNSITVKIGRCTSPSECGIDFFKNK